MGKIGQRILKITWIQSIVGWSKKNSLPMLSGMPIFDVTKFYIDGIVEGSINTRASAMAFKFFIAIFPGSIFLFSLIPFLPIDNLQAELLLQMKLLLPESAYELTQETISDLVVNKRGNLLSFGFLMTIYFATNGAMAMMDALNESHNLNHKRSGIEKRLAAVVLTLILSILVIVGISIIIFSEIGVDVLIKYGFLSDRLTVYLIQMGNWATIIAIIFFCISFIYYFAPAKRKHWDFFSPGSILSTFFILLTCLGFAWYINNFGENNYNKLYGSIGTLLIIMLWLNINSVIILLGFELNASIQNARNSLNSKC